MKIICKKCKAEYDLDLSLVGRKVECECGEKWILREVFPHVISAKSLNDGFEEALLNKRYEEAVSIIAAFKEKTRQQYEEYLRLTITQAQDENGKYEYLKYLCSCGNPVPSTYKEFFKLCRKRNAADKKVNSWLAIIDRILFMEKLDKKKRDIIWLTTARNNGIKRSVIDEHYCSITETDRKNLDFAMQRITEIQ
jgi:hypothetical protein